MPWFRSPPTSPGPELPSDLRPLLTDLMLPCHFSLGPGTQWEWENGVPKEIVWETFQSRLLDPAHSRERRRFEAWNLFSRTAAGRSAEPVLSLKLDAAAGQIHVVRAIDSYVWEGYHAGDNIYLSRETRKWVRELVGTIDLRRFATAAELRDEVMCLLFQAVVGTSRLPLTSVEAPLPGFSLGGLAYFYRPEAARGPAGEPMRSYHDLLQGAFHSELAWAEKVKLLEILLRSTPAEDVGGAAGLFVGRWEALGHDKPDLVRLLRALFNDVALSPYTGFVDRVLAFVRHLADRDFLTVADEADFLSYLLRHVCRHLTAYDLITFHHRGANYPDALLLDAALKAYLTLAERRPDLLAAPAEDGEQEQARKRVRRRALRQGYVLRRRYEGLPVPEAPTSPGENARVVPPPHVRVPEDQILFPAKRSRRLYADDPLANYLGPRAQTLLRQSVADLCHPQELLELGMAVFLDRPLGVFKAPGEPDQTPLLSYEAFSRSVAEGRLQSLAADLGLINDPGELQRYQEALRRLPVNGVQPPAGAQVARPGTVSLADANQVAEDFLILRTTRRSLTEFLALFDFSPLGEFPALADLSPGRFQLVMPRPSQAGLLAVYDDHGQCRLELQVDPGLGYAGRGGSEYPAAGLRALRAWAPASDGLRAQELSCADTRLPPAAF